MSTENEKTVEQPDESGRLHFDVSTDPPRAFTVDEARTEFLKSIQVICQYWSKQNCDSALDMCNGVAFSILNIFDGTHAGIPALDILLSPHEDDKQYNIENGDNYYEHGMMINDCCLHELFYKC